MGANVEQTGGISVSDDDHAIKVEPGDRIGIRTDWNAIVVGSVGTINPKQSLIPGRWLVIIESPTMWDVSEGGGFVVPVDKGKPIDRSDDWDGPGCSIGVGTDRYGFDFSGDVILRQPDPVYSDGVLKHYVPLPAGRITALITGDDVEPKHLLKEDDERPKGIDQ